MLKTFSTVDFRKYLLPILAGILIGTSFIPFPPWASLFGFIPLWIFWFKCKDLKSIIYGGVVTSFTLTLIGFNWMAQLFHEFAHMPWPIAVLALFGFCLVANLFIPLAGAVWFLAQKKWSWSRLRALTGLAIFTALSEHYSFTLFDWNFGYTWFAWSAPLMNWAEYIGFTGISALTILTNAPLLIAWENRNTRKGKVIFATVIGLFFAANLTGVMIQNQLKKPDSKAKVLLVQANIGNIQKQAAELGRGFRDEILDKYIKITQKGLNEQAEQKIDFIMWPETAFPSLLGQEYQYRKLPTRLRRFIYDNQVPLVTGAYGKNRDSGLTTNSIFVLDQDGVLQEPHYIKSILLAFGEYIPGETLYPPIRSWFPPTGHFHKGDGPTVLLRVDDIFLGPQICYESLFPKFSKALADLGADMIINSTNDSWYGTWQEPFQHMYMTLSRSIEFRRPILRVTNTGISTVALADGTILERSPLQKAWAGLYEVSYIKKPTSTFYQNWIWLTPALLIVSTLLQVFWGFRAKPDSN